MIVMNEPIIYLITTDDKINGEQKYIEIYDTSEDVEKDLRKYGELKSMGVLKSYDFKSITLTALRLMKMETIIKYINLDNMVKLLKYLLHLQYMINLLFLRN